MYSGFSLKRLVEKAAGKLNIPRSAGFLWSKGIRPWNSPLPMTGGGGLSRADCTGRRDTSGVARILAFLT